MEPNTKVPAVLPVLPFNYITQGTATVNTGPLEIELTFNQTYLYTAWQWQDRLHSQAIKRIKFKNSTWVICPECRNKTWRLFATKGEGPFLCRGCAGVKGYPYWHQNGQVRQPQKPAKWLGWLKRKAEHILKEEVY